MGVAIPTVNNSTTNNTNIGNAMYANTIQTTGTMAGTAVMQNPKTNDLFDSLPQGLNNQITNNNTGKIIHFYKYFEV